MKQCYRRSVSAGADRGMSLIEVVVAAILLGILSSAVLAVILQTQNAGTTNRARISAASLAAREIDLVRDEFTRSDTEPLLIAGLGTQTNVNPLPGQVSGAPHVINGTAFTVVRSVAWNITGSGASACAGGSLVIYPTLAVTVRVTWPGMGSVQPVVSTASLAPSKGNGIPGTSSFIAVTVLNSAGQPNVGRSVTVSGGSEVKTGTTDASGCAVLQVNPASGTGTSYTAALGDPGYVDLARVANPVMNIGTVTQGQLNNNAKFSYDVAGSLELHFVDGAGNPVLSSDVAGQQVTLDAAEFAGASPLSSWSVTGAITTISGLWPTGYGAYLGSVAPPLGYSSVPVGPGLTATLPVTVAMATTSLTGLPAAWTSIIAVPGAVTDCTATGHRTVNPASISVLPGTWTFFATGPTYDCSPGPQPDLVAGPQAAVPWLPTTLQVTNAPAGHLWAVNLTKVPGPLVTCPGSTYAAFAVDVDGARTGAVAIPAGSGYVYDTNGTSTGTCVGVPAGQYSKALAYGYSNILTWVVPTSTLIGTGASKYYAVLVSTAPVSNCTTTTYTTSGVSVASAISPSSTTNLSLTVNRPASGTQTWYAYYWKTSNTAGCTAAGTYVVGPSTVSLSKSASSTGTVGP